MDKWYIHFRGIIIHLLRVRTLRLFRVIIRSELGDFKWFEYAMICSCSYAKKLKKILTFIIFISKIFEMLSLKWFYQLWWWDWHQHEFLLASPKLTRSKFDKKIINSQTKKDDFSSPAFSLRWMRQNRQDRNFEHCLSYLRSYCFDLTPFS